MPFALCPSDRLLASAVAALGVMASGAGLFVPGVYRDPAGIVPAMQGQDLVTVVAAPLLGWAAILTARGSARARLSLLGLTGYMTYTYAGAAFGYRLNRVLPVYVAILSCSVLLLVRLTRRLELEDIQTAFDARTPRRPVAVFLALIGAMLFAIEFGELGRYVVTGVVPPSVVRAGDWNFFPYVLDLGFVAPLTMAAAWQVWRRRAVGDVLAAVLLVKAAAMGLALVAMNALTAQAGLAPDGLTPFYAFIAAGGLGLSVWFLASWRTARVETWNISQTHRPL